MRLRPLLLPLSGIVALAVGLVTVGDLNGNLVYYLTPDEAVERRAEFPEDRRFRLAGEVGGEEVRRSEHGASFTVAGSDVEVAVVHAGVVPHLFQAGIPVVVEGAWRGEVFRSDTMLIKHDEEYYPADEADDALAGPADSGTDRAAGP
ncbi:MAG: cytochrome c maturation protein CcmE [Actinobacteria bacterium]|jgi:cytochrome c-type biogenesis protein CcmE|nr:cytochrome c maturation protein CcmE [Actinomycetota bacterium]